MLWITNNLMLHAFFQKLRPSDVIACLVIIGGFYLLLNGINGTVGLLLVTVVTYYFVSAKKHDDTTTSKPRSGDGGV